MGLKEQTIFPEIVFDKVDKARGMNVTFVTTAESDNEGYVLLEEIGHAFSQKLI
jgi:large subunit ribosomal protein L5